VAEQGFFEFRWIDVLPFQRLLIEWHQEPTFSSEKSVLPNVKRIRDGNQQSDGARRFGRPRRSGIPDWEKRMSSSATVSSCQPLVFPKGRKWKKIRFPSGPDTACRLFAGPEAAPVPVSIRYLSGMGISLILPGRMEVGPVVRIQLFNQGRQFQCQATVRLATLDELPDGTVVIEGSFSRELSNEELHGLL
jgi:hypothetical protein